MSCEINDRIKANILDKIAEMSLEDKKLYLINYVKNVLKDYDGDELDEAVREMLETDDEDADEYNYSDDYSGELTDDY